MMNSKGKNTSRPKHRLGRTYQVRRVELKHVLERLEKSVPEKFSRIEAASKECGMKVKRSCSYQTTCTLSKPSKDGWQVCGCNSILRPMRQAILDHDWSYCASLLEKLLSVQFLDTTYLLLILRFLFILLLYSKQQMLIDFLRSLNLTENQDLSSMLNDISRLPKDFSTSIVRMRNH